MSSPQRRLPSGLIPTASLCLAAVFIVGSLKYSSQPVASVALDLCDGAVGGGAAPPPLTPASVSPVDLRGGADGGGDSTARRDGAGAASVVAEAGAARRDGSARVWNAASGQPAAKGLQSSDASASGGGDELGRAGGGAGSRVGGGESAVRGSDVSTSGGGDESATGEEQGGTGGGAGGRESAGPGDSAGSDDANAAKTEGAADGSDAAATAHAYGFQATPPASLPWREVPNACFEHEYDLLQTRQPVSPELPVVLLIGQQKAGTTWFYELLSQHPAVVSALDPKCVSRLQVLLLPLLLSRALT